jgi:hypothetical protein
MGITEGASGEGFRSALDPKAMTIKDAFNLRRSSGFAPPPVGNQVELRVGSGWPTNLTLP